MNVMELKAVLDCSTPYVAKVDKFEKRLLDVAGRDYGRVLLDVDTSRAEAKLKDLKQLLKPGGAAGKVQVQADTTGAQRKVQGLQDTINRVLKAGAVQVKADTREADKALRDLERDRARLNRETEIKVKADTRDAEAKLAKLTRDAEGASNRIGDTLSRGSTIAGAGIVGALALATREGIKFESSFTGVRKTVDATEAQFAELEKQIRAMASGPNAIPISVHELNAIAEAAGQLGVQTKSISTFTRTIADLSRTTNLSSSEAADSLARLANITQLPHTEFDRLGSTLTDLGNRFASTEKEIVAMALRIAGAGHQVGMTEAEILAFANTLASVGVKAEAGGSAISRVFIAIDKAARGGGKELDNFSAVAGSSAARFKQAYQQDAAGAIRAFIEGLGRIKQSGGDVFGVLEKLGLNEIRVRDALLRTAGAGDLLARSLDVGKKAWQDNSALTIEAQQRYKTMESQLLLLRNDVVDLAIDASKTLLPALRSLVDIARPAVKWFNDLDRSTQDTAVKFTAAAGVALLLGGRIRDVTGFVKDLRTITVLSTIAADRHAVASGREALAIIATGDAAVATSGKIAGLIGLLKTGLRLLPLFVNAPVDSQQRGQQILNWAQSTGRLPGGNGVIPGDVDAGNAAERRSGEIINRMRQPNRDRPGEALRLLQGHPSRAMIADINASARIINRDRKTASQAWAKYLDEWNQTQQQKDSFNADIARLLDDDDDGGKSGKGHKGRKAGPKLPPNLTRPMSVSKLRNAAAAQELKAVEARFNDQAKQIKQAQASMMKASEAFKKARADAFKDAADAIQEARDAARLDAESEQLARRGATPEQIKTQRALSEYRLRLWRGNGPAARLYNLKDKAGANRVAGRMMGAEVERLGAEQSAARLDKILSGLPDSFANMLKGGEAWADSIASTLTSLNTLIRDRGRYRAPEALSDATRSAVAGMESDAALSQLEANLTRRGVGSLATARKMEMAKFAAGLSGLSTAEAIAQLEAFEKKQDEALRTDALQQYAAAWGSMSSAIAAANPPSVPGHEELIRLKMRAHRERFAGIGDAMGSVAGGGELWEGTGKLVEETAASRDKVAEYLRDIEDRVRLVKIANPIERELQNVRQGLRRQKWTDAEIEAILPAAEAGLRIEQQMARVQELAGNTRNVIRDSLATGFEEGIGAGARSFISGLAKMIRDQALNNLADQITNRIFRRSAGGDVLERGSSVSDIISSILGRRGGVSVGGFAGGTLQFPQGAPDVRSLAPYANPAYQAALAGPAQYLPAIATMPQVMRQSGGGVAETVGAIAGAVGIGGGNTVQVGDLTIRAERVNLSSPRPVSPVSKAGSGPSDKQIAQDVLGFILGR